MNKEELDFLKSTGVKFKEDHWTNGHDGTLEYNILCITPEGFEFIFYEKDAESISLNDFNSRLCNVRVSSWFEFNSYLIRSSLEENAKIFFDLNGRLPNIEDLLK